MKTRLLGQNEIQQAAEILRRGGLVAVPTETVYGLAAVATDAAAVEAVYEAKGRPETKPISLLVSSMDMVRPLCRDIPPTAFRLAEAFWPGPLTLVLQDGGIVPPVVRAGGSTLGVRCPDHPVTLALIEELGAPLAAPSANISGMPSPKNARAVLEGLGGRIDAVLDGGPCTVGVESTILDLTVPAPRILRQGGLPAADLEAVIRRRSLKVIGITGPTGAGKTTALEALEGMGCAVIDADAVYHRLTGESAELRGKLEVRFGPVYDESGALDRKRLGDVVFRDPEALEELNRITHAHVGAEIGRLLDLAEAEGYRCAAVDAIALLESGLGALCDAVVGVLAPPELRVKRIMAREGISEDYARMRVTAQMGDDYYRQRCAYILENSEADTPERFAARAAALFSDILRGN